MFIFGGLSTIIAGILEYICLDFLDDYFYTDTIAYIAIEAFLIVGLAEEFGKYFIVKKQLIMLMNLKIMIKTVVNVVYVVIHYNY